ncbi:MAG: orotidine-5'-phosphate decarboxylase [Desulfitobacteriaceae bacterium]|nr:orotidine-5'-phosphate decarboxylase [Desulfitobacteriaceae bacterium]
MIKELNKKIIVAVDVDGKEKALELARKLQGSGCWLKVGLELYSIEGPAILQELKELGFPIFLDLKLHDIPNTVERAIRGLMAWGADIINVHCSGGYEMMARAAEAVHAQSGNRQRTKLIGVTVLTSLSEKVLQEDLGVGRGLESQVIGLAQLAQRAGLDGVVVSAKEAAALRQACGEDFLLVTPGIRPAWGEKNDQVRVMTPREAIKVGSSYLVVGRPITRAADPLRALNHLWDE